MVTLISYLGSVYYVFTMVLIFVSYFMQWSEEIRGVSNI